MYRPQVIPLLAFELAEHTPFLPKPSRWVKHHCDRALTVSLFLFNNEHQLGHPASLMAGHRSQFPTPCLSYEAATDLLSVPFRNISAKNTTELLGCLRPFDYGNVSPSIGTDGCLECPSFYDIMTFSHVDWLCNWVFLSAAVQAVREFHQSIDV